MKLLLLYLEPSKNLRLNRHQLMQGGYRIFLHVLLIFRTATLTGVGLIFRAGFYGFVGLICSLLHNGNNNLEADPALIL